MKMIINIIKDIVKENKKVLLGVLILLFFIITIIAIWHKYNNAKLEVERLRNNIESLQSKDDNNKKIDQYLTKEEFKEYYSHLVKYLSDIDKGVKDAKQINNVTHISNYYVDSSNVYYNAAVIDTNPNIYNISYHDTCWGFDGIFNKLNNRVTIFDKQFSNELYLFEYWKRDNLFGLKLFPKWGKKVEYRKAWTSCNGDTVTINKINVIKKKDFKSK